MTKTILLSELVSSNEFLEGSSLFHDKAAILLSTEKKEKFLKISGRIKSKDRADSSILIESSGKIVSTECSANCRGVCRHVVALALLYNELSMGNSDISEQLSVLGKRKTRPTATFPLKVSIEKKQLRLTFDKNNSQLLKLVEELGERNLVVLVSLFPESMVLGTLPLFEATSPLPFFYEIEKERVKFSFSDFIHYFDQEGVVINGESGAVWRFPSDVNEAVSTLLNVSMEYSKKDDLVKAIADLSDNLSPFISLNGEFNLEKIELDEKTEILFDTYIENEKVCVLVFFEYQGNKIEFKPKRKNYDQNYPFKGKVYALSPELLKIVRFALNKEGFRQGKKYFHAHISHLSSIIKENSSLNEVGKVVLRKEINKISFSESAADNVEITLDINAQEKWFSFNIKLPDSANLINSSELIKAVVQYEKGVTEPVVTDIKGVPVILEKSSNFLKKITELVFSEHPSLKEKIPVAHLLKMLKSKNKKVLNSFIGSEETEQKYVEIIKSLSKGTLPEVSLQHVSNIPIRNYQIEGFKWMTLLRDMGLGGILADEMGLGKTLQALTVIKSEEDDKPSLVVCPKTLVWGWDREIEKFFPDMKRTVIDSLKPEERVRFWKKTGNELIITSYALIVNDFSYLKGKLFKTIVIDEAQHIKNSNTKRFKALYALKAEHKFALTGTPLENHLSDLWSIFQFIMPGYLGSKREIDKSEKDGDEESLEKLRKLAAPFILRRTKKETVAELPELIIKEYPVEMTPKQKEIYLSVLLRGRAEFIEKGDAINKIEILSILSNLRLAANHPALVSKVENDPFLSSKIPVIHELTDEIIEGGGRVLIFSQYVKMLKIVASAFDAKERDYFYMDGKSKERIEMVERFNKGEKEIFLLSLKVGGVGLNLTGADNVIIVDPWWNPAIEEQAWSRAHRIGQEKKVVVNKLFSKGTIEEKILDLHQKKRDMTNFFLSQSLKNPSIDFIKMVADMEFSNMEKI
ncbi:MAG: DEAD/DEAH box helicase [bacterium]